MEKLFEYIFPSSCFSCNKASVPFCNACLNGCEILNDQLCIVCDNLSIRGKTHINCSFKEAPVSIFSSFIYKGLVRECIRRSKYGPMEFASLKLLTREACIFARKAGQKYKDYIVVPIPLSKQRLRERGFNQSELIGKVSSFEFGIQMDSSLLARITHTAPQAGLTRDARLLNLADVFIAHKSVSTKKILLVDDVTTTGATLLSAGSALYKAGASEVSCFAVSKKL